MMYITNLTLYTEEFATIIPYVPIGQWRMDAALYTYSNITSKKSKDHILTLKWIFEVKLSRPIK